METYTRVKALTENPYYQLQRQQALRYIKKNLIDPPIVDLITRFNRLPYCFSQQCCFGHFVHSEETDIHNVNPLPAQGPVASLTYRIAYIAFCVANTFNGRKWLVKLKQLEEIDPKNIQFFCADWFWAKQANSYALQVMPDRFKDLDQAGMDLTEALEIERLRGEFFLQLDQALQSEQKIV